MHVSDFLFDSFKFVTSSDHVIEQVPNFSFVKVPVDFESVFNFAFKYV